MSLATKTNAELRTEKDSLFKQMGEIIENRDLFEANPVKAKERYDALDAEFNAVVAELEKRQDPLPPAIAGAFGGGWVGEVPPSGGSYSTFDLRKATSLTQEQRFSDWSAQNESVPQEHRELGFGKFMRGMLTDHWDNADAERRAMGELTGAGGGHLVPAPLSADIIDLARNKTRVLQAGARTIPMTSQTLKIPRLTAGIDPLFHAENEADITEGGPLFDAVTFTAHTMTSPIIRASREVIEDANELEQVLMKDITDAFALKLDWAALYGSGTGDQPTGVKVTPNINTAISMGTNGAALTNYDPFVNAIGTLGDQNFDATGIIYSARTARAIAMLKDTTNQPLSPPEYVQRVPRYDTNQVPNNLTKGSATNASEAFVGHWPELVIGFRNELRIEVLKERYADYLQVAFLAYLRFDVQVLRPKAFGLVQGIIP